MACRFCEIVKPLRTHHCRRCRKCILKMDHHCGYLNNCIGFGNYRPYIVFLFYTMLLCFFLSTTMLRGLKFYINSEEAMTTIILVYILSYLLVVLGLVVTGGLFFTHLTFILRGVTTIEDKGSLLENITGVQINSCMENLREVFGEGNMITWLWPTVNKSVIYSGYIYSSVGQNEYRHNFEEYIRNERLAFINTLNVQLDKSSMYEPGINNNSILTNKNK